MPKDPKSTLIACATAVMEHDEESQSIQREDKPTDLTLVSYHFVLVSSINTSLSVYSVYTVYTTVQKTQLQLFCSPRLPLFCQKTNKQ